MNPDFFWWLLIWVALSIAFYFLLGYFVPLDMIPHVLITTNIITFILVLLDKISASMRMRRVPENVLYVATFFGGSIGMLVGMVLIHHKNRKVSFQFVVGILVLIQMILLLWHFNPNS